MRHEETASALAELVRDGTSGSVTPDVHASGRERLLASLDAPRKNQRWAAAGAIAIAASVALFLWFQGRERALTYRVDGAPQASYVASSNASLTFSDGTVVKSNGRLRVSSVDAHGAHVVLEDGAIDVDVVHAAKTHWSFDAGPYRVVVTGTAFTLDWHDDHLELRMKHGSVRVEGPLASPGVSVVTGQTLDARPLDHFLAVRQNDAKDEPAPTPTLAPTAIANDPEPTATAPRAIVPSPSWTSLVAAGSYARVVHDAESDGLDACLAKRPLADLAALADAARYLRRFDVAERALGAERARFPQSSESRDAAFMLGRVAEDSGDSNRALGRYDAYLSESADGSFAAEALGRKLAILRAQNKRDDAIAVAHEYLRRFPNGPYARVARDVEAP